MSYGETGKSRHHRFPARRQVQPLQRMCNLKLETKLKNVWSHLSLYGALGFLTPQQSPFQSMAALFETYCVAWYIARSGYWSASWDSSSSE